MRRTWIGFALLIVLIGIVVTLRGTAANDSPDHSSQSDGNNGTSALRYFAQALGDSTSTVEGDFSLPSSRALLFVFSPSTGYSLSEAQQLQQWVAAGNVLIYADETGDPELDSQLGLRRSSTGVDATAQAAAPVFGGVNRLSGGSQASFFQTTASEVAILRNPAGAVLGVRLGVGSGTVIALADPLPLCNAYLRLADNGRFAADLIAMTPPGATVLFDEYHHGDIAGDQGVLSWITTPWGAALALAVLVIFVGLALRGRAFGPTVALAGIRDRSSAEYAVAVGNLLHRTGARSVALQTLLAATRRTVAERVGLSSDTPPDQVKDALAQRAPATGRELAALEAAVAGPMSSEDEVLAVARRLHALAHPPSTAVRAKGES